MLRLAFDWELESKKFRWKKSSFFALSTVWSFFLVLMRAYTLSSFVQSFGFLHFFVCLRSLHFRVIENVFFFIQQTIFSFTILIWEPKIKTKIFYPVCFWFVYNVFQRNFLNEIFLIFLFIILSRKTSRDDRNSSWAILWTLKTHAKSKVRVFIKRMLLVQWKQFVALSIPQLFGWKYSLTVLY